MAFGRNKLGTMVRFFVLVSMVMANDSGVGKQTSHLAQELSVLNSVIKTQKLKTKHYY